MSLSLPDQPSRNRSASAGDSGLPEHEHKRPRLSDSRDHGNETVTMSNSNQNEPPVSLPVGASSAKSSESTSALGSPPHSPLPAKVVPDATSPTSKVTINTRPLSSQSSNILTQPATLNDRMSPIDLRISAASQAGGSTSSDKQERPETISISSSECNSPLIQIAVPEDLDQDAAETQWEPLSASSSSRHIRIQSGHIQRTFPYAEQSTRTQAYAVVMQISKVFLEGAASDGEIFQKVKTWMVEFATHAHDLSFEFFDEDREFWAKFPVMSANLLKRKEDLSSDVHNDDLVDFFVAYARITTYITQADTEKLRLNSETTDVRTLSNPRCLNFLSQLNWMMMPDNVPLYETMRESLDHNPRLVVESIMDQLIASHALKHLQCLTSLFQVVADLLPKRPAFFEPCLSLVAHAGSFLGLLLERVNSIPVDSATVDNTSLALCTESSEFLQLINTVLDRAITKQQPWLNIETCEKLFKTVGPFVDAIAMNFPQLAIDLITAANIESSDFQDGELCSLASTAWKLFTIHKFIKRGRMEVRVTCVQTIGQDLVEVYHNHIRGYRDLEHPKVRLMIQFIRRNDIIRYIIGVDSHAQIIERSCNIIGFLCVSRSYRNEDTDAIWQTVLGSPDPRLVVALLGSFQTNLDNLDVDILCYIMRKVLSSPAGRVDHAMLEFILRLINAVDVKIKDEPIGTQLENEADECIIRISLKLLQESSTHENICTELSARIRSQIQNVLVKTLKTIREKTRHSNGVNLVKPLVVDLCNDIRNHNNFTSGSTLALINIIQGTDHEECMRIIEEYKIPTLLIEDLCYACNATRSNDTKEPIWVEFDIKYSLMITIVFHASELISESFLRSLWTNVLSNPDIQARLRQMAWRSLASTLR